MAGREISQIFPKKHVTIEQEILNVKNLYKKTQFKNINFNLRKKEILGFYGLVGSGRTEVMKTIFGINKFDEIFKNFKHNISFFGDRATLHRETSDVFFSKNTKNFDLVYNDGSHFGDDVYRDSVNAFKVLNKKGYIIFDDKTFACGSSYHKNKNIQNIDQDVEEKSLEKKIDWFDDKSKIQNAKKQIWTGNRFTTKQRIPYVGKVLKEVKQSHNGMEFIWRDNILINSFYGSKGFTLAPLASRIIVKILTGDLDELDAKFLNYLNPYQNFIKGHNKKNIIGFNYA